LAHSCNDKDKRKHPTNKEGQKKFNLVIIKWKVNQKAAHILESYSGIEPIFVRVFRRLVCVLQRVV
jgi:hypothetical protein